MSPARQMGACPVEPPHSCVLTWLREARIVVDMMTPDKIRTLRASLEENTATFGARFHVSGRTVENWEQGRHEPHRLVVVMLETLAREMRDAKRGARA